MSWEEKTSVTLEDDETIVVRLHPVAAYFLYFYVAADRRPWNVKLYKGIGDIMDTRPEIFDRYGDR